MNTMDYMGKNVAITFLPHGDIKEITANTIMINQFVANEFDGSLNNLFLRIHEKNKITTYPLIGKKSKSDVLFFENGVRFTGQINKINYKIDFKLTKQDVWFWEISLKGNGEAVDIIYGQDLGLANQAVVLTNEAYNSQYLDQSAYQSDTGFNVCTRQNMPQGTKFPYLQQGGLTPVQQYSTDGYQFFSKNDLNDMTANLSQQTDLPSSVYQYEMAYTGLQSSKIILSDTPQSVVFYSAYLDNHSEAVANIAIPINEIQTSFNQSSDLSTNVKEVLAVRNHVYDISGEELSAKEIDSLFPTRKVEEKAESGKLLSFFDDKDYHIVLKEKEMLMERSHGHIILSGEEETIDRPVMASTLYMNGLFNSQIVLGNTTINKFISNTRSALNLLKKSGQRLFVKLNGDWHRLGIPSAFKIGFNFATWFYKIEDDLIEVTSYTIGESRSIQFNVKSQQNKKYDWLISFDIVMNDSEGTNSYLMTNETNLLTFKATSDSAISPKYPDLRYYIDVKQDFNVLSAKDMFSMTTDENLLLLEIKHSASTSLTIQGTMSNQEYRLETDSFEQAIKEYDTYLSALSNQFNLEHANQHRLDKMNALVKWYTQNMLVHYLSPHGLEQYGGAAWGTRDICQGPVEYFFAMNKPEIVRSIILKIYANQFDDDGNWPQWFMFDKFEEIKADESHGDIIVWPLKVVSDYLNVTKDFSILEEQVPYSSRKYLKQTERTESIRQHIEKQLTYIEANFLEGTFLPCYGDGDWDDTLQPADQSLKKNMASSWTVALTYQTLKLFSEVMLENDEQVSLRVDALYKGVYQDFHKYMLQDDIIPGFLFMDDNKQPELIIHPKDQRTGINYRLLPMTRSMISELIDKDDVDKHVNIIQDHLVFPDAVRLMNQPAHYAGGVSTNFKRAEQAANLGREVGLAYIHAHIRYIEAMAKIGKSDETWMNLEKINPIGISEIISNNQLRQSNAYFSSSDGDFATRYDAQEHFDELKTKQRDVKGGWRIYSSGPGIYINQLISNVLGIRKDHKELTFDPILPDELDQLVLTYQFEDRLLKIIFNLSKLEKTLKINGKLIPTIEKQNRYRNEGLTVSLESFYSHTTTEGVNEIELFIGEM